MSAAAPLGILLGLAGAILAGSRLAKTTRRNREGFDGDNRTIATQESVVSTSQQFYNPLTSLLDLGKNPFVGPQPSANDIVNSRNDIRGAMNGLDVKFPKTGAGVQIKGGEKTPYTIPNNTSGLRAYAVQKCEKVTTANCSAFDDPEFTANCGICFKPGTDSQSQGHIGGLFLDPQDKTAAELQSEALGEKKVHYTPSVGTCPPGFFMINRKQCDDLARRIECENKKTYDLPNCSQCYTDSSFTIVDAAVPLADLSLVVNFIGSLTVVVGGKTIVSGALSTTSGDNSFDLGVVPEGSAIFVTVDGASLPSGTSASIGGFIQGPTVTGVFQLQLAQLADADLVSGQKPRVSGEVLVSGQSVLQMKPGRGYKRLNLRVNIPVTFVDPTDDAAAKCASGPFLTLEGSAKVLNSGTCFQPGNGVGSYSQNCLQEKFTELGCTTEGTGYPSDTVTVGALNIDSSGKPRALGDITDIIYENAVRSSTGTSTSGQKLGLSEWNQASMFCTGKQITSACDAVTITGQMTTDCMAELYNNRGLGTRTGATYTGSRGASSLTKVSGGVGDASRYCTTAGLLSPFGPDGAPQQDAIQRAFATGGTIQNIKDLYDQTHRRANDNSLADSDRADAIADCYGVGLDSAAGSGAANITPSAAAVLKSQLDSVNSQLQYLYGYGLGPGSGNATFDRLYAQQQSILAQAKTTIKARYIRIKPSQKLAPSDRCIQISQLQVFNASGQEVAKGKSATASSVLGSTDINARFAEVKSNLQYLYGLGLGPGSGNVTFDRLYAQQQTLTEQLSGLPVPGMAVDGTTSARSMPQIFHDACDTGGKDQWWMVDLGTTQDLSYIVYYNRGDCCAKRADGMPVELLDDQQNIVGATQIQGSSSRIEVHFTIFDTQNLPWINLA